MNAGALFDFLQEGGLKKSRTTSERELKNQAMDRNDGIISADTNELGVNRPTF
jgi:hypothetical protein